MSPAIRLIACALLAVAAPSLRAAVADPATPAPMQQALLLRVDGELSIDPQGVPIAYRIKTQLPQKLHDSLEQHVRSWRFEPVLVGGKPVLAQTQMRVTLAAQGTGDDYRVAVDNVTFPQTSGATPDASGNAEPPPSIDTSRLNMVSYPRAALEYDLEADVVVNLMLTPEGKVAQASVAQVGLLNVKGKSTDLQRASAIFERQVLDDVKQWRFKVAVSGPNPTARDLTVAVPITFRMTDKHTDRRTGWQQEFRTPKLRAPWLSPDPNEQSAGVADLVAGELAPASGRFRLTAPVAGSLL